MTLEQNLKCIISRVGHHRFYNQKREIINVLNDEYINQFSPDINTKLFNLNSGVAIPENIAKEILTLQTVKTVECANEFQNEGLSSTSAPFHDRIKRHNIYVNEKANYIKGKSKKSILASPVDYTPTHSGRVLEYPLSISANDRARTPSLWILYL